MGAPVTTDLSKTPEREVKRSSRRTRLSSGMEKSEKSETPTNILTSDSKPVSEAVPEVKKSRVNDDDEEITIVEENITTVNLDNSEKSPKKRGPKPGSKNKPRAKKVPDENVDPSNKQQSEIKQKKRKPQSKVEQLLETFKGPFVHIDGSFRSPNYVAIVNTPHDSLKPSNIKKQYGIKDSEIRSKTTYGPQSTLSKQYDYKNLDPTWCCFFCHKPSHYKKLGDLFGPYYVPTRIIKPIKNTTTSNSESPKKGAKRRRKSELSEPEPAPIPTPPQVGDKSEIWFHEDCYIWIPCTHLVGGRLVGMEEAVEQCQELSCSVCGVTGASVGCTVHTCKRAAHLCCAREDGWKLDMHNFAVRCSNCQQ